MTADLLERLFQGDRLEKPEFVEILCGALETGTTELFRYARSARDGWYGRKIFVRGLVEFSSYCRQDCLYCGIRHSNRQAQRYRLRPEEIIEVCEQGYHLGYRTFVLQSGEDPWYTGERLANVVTAIKSRCDGAAVTLSIGQRPRETYELLYKSGVDRFLMRHETANESLYQTLHPSMNWRDRVRCLTDLTDIGYQVGAGSMVGLPGQTVSALADDLMFLQALRPHMIGIGPFIPHSQTPLAGTVGGTAKATLVMIALARLVVQDSLIPATTALATLVPDGREQAFTAGANVVMPILTPLGVRKKYALYEGKRCVEDTSIVCRQCLQGRIEAAGYEYALERGDSCRSSSFA